MKVVGLDGRPYKLTANRDNAERTKKSSGHLEARALLGELWPFDLVLEEVHIPGCGTPLYLDFFLPKRVLSVEVQGAHHRKYIPYFHGTTKGFLEQKQRDSLKEQFCHVNNIFLAVLHDDDRDNWRNIILATVSRRGQVTEGI